MSTTGSVWIFFLTMIVAMSSMPVSGVTKTGSGVMASFTVMAAIFATYVSIWCEELKGIIPSRSVKTEGRGIFFC